MASMRPEQAKQFYEEDEDPQRVIALFDAAQREGRLAQTKRPEPRSDLMPLGELIAELVRELRRELRELRLRERVAQRLDRAARALRSKTRVR